MKQVVQIWHNLCSELTSMCTLKIYSCIYKKKKKKTNEPTASDYKSDIWDNILKDHELSKYKRESKGRMSIKHIILFLFMVILFRGQSWS